METKFKDVANLYLGCEMIIESTGEKYIFKPSNMPSNWKDSHIRYGGKPILKHLSDIEEQDQAFLTELVNNPKPIQFLPIDGNKFTGINQSATYGFTYLLSKGYDLFNLIETGQAINAKTV